MALTTHEKIRVEAGFQYRYNKDSFILGPTAGGATTFHVQADDNVKFVPEFNTGNTIAGVSDVKVFIGLDGISGVSRVNVTAIDIDSGSVTLDTPPVSGSSLTISYSTSPIESQDIENHRLRAESMINQRLSLCYNLPIAPIPSVLTGYASRLSAAFLMIRGYGVGSRDTAADGYALYEQLMGTGTDASLVKNVAIAPDVGEIGMICRPSYQLVDDNGQVISRNDEERINSNNLFKSGGRVNGRLYDITEEKFRRKNWQQNVNSEQPGVQDIPEPQIQN